MGIRVPRQKPRHWLLSIAYRLQRLIPSRWRLDLLLDLEWVAARLAHEAAVTQGLDDRAKPFLTSRIKPTDRVLDIGCGHGRLAALLPGQVLGLDHTPAYIEEARKAAPNATFVCADAAEFLATADAFDVAILNHVLEHIDDPEAMLRSIDAEHIFVEVPDFDSIASNPFRLIRGRPAYTDNDHVAELDRDELEALFARCGLIVEAREFRHAVMRYWLRAPSRS